MSPKLVNHLIFIHEHPCSCSDCGTGPASDTEVEQVWFDCENGGGGGKSIRKAVKRMVKNWAAMRLVLGPNPDSILRHLSVQLTPTTAAVLAFQYGKVVLARPLTKTKLHDYKLGLELKSSSDKRKTADENLLRCKSLLNHSSTDSACSKLGCPFGLKGASRAIKAGKDEIAKVGCESESENSTQVLELCPCVEVHESDMGWPLRRISVPKILQTTHMSKSENAASFLPERSVSVSSSFCSSDKSYIESSDSSYTEKINEQCYLSPIEKLRKDIEKVLSTTSADIKIFSYQCLQRATSDFSPGNLVGIGGSSSVYKGCLPNGKLVAIKIFKLYKEAGEDFFTEINITSSLKHSHIVPLAGVCLDQDCLISVYDLLPQGSLEEHLHGYKRKPGLPWETRFKIALAVAEALTYLHDECPRPVIHRDVKSSNILLSDDFQPQLSDFGLAMWGPTSELSPTVTKDVLGTFGYIAPEYFMNGKVSDKIDVYSYGVVLLELLSGRRPVNLKAQKGQESIVKWAKQLIDSADVSALLDPKLGDKVDTDQICKMVLAAYLCTSQSAERRPKMSHIQNLLKGGISVKQLIKSDQNHINESQGCDEEDQVWGSLLSSSVLKVANDSLSTFRPRLRRRKSLADCLKECDRRVMLADLLKQEDHDRPAMLADLLKQEDH